jgi:large subunit ribosomal protein L5
MTSQAAQAVTAPPRPRLLARYQEQVAPPLLREFGYRSAMQVPRLQKIVVNIGLGEALDNAKALDFAVADLTAITGQKPIVTKARKAISNFKLRAGRQIGVKVTLRGERMYHFLDRLVNVALARRRDFRASRRTP